MEIKVFYLEESISFFEIVLFLIDFIDVCQIDLKIFGFVKFLI